MPLVVHVCPCNDKSILNQYRQPNRQNQVIGILLRVAKKITSHAIITDGYILLVFTVAVMTEYIRWYCIESSEIFIVHVTITDDHFVGDYH